MKYHQSFIGLSASLLPLLCACFNAQALEFDVDGTQVSLGGYAKLTAIYDHDGTITAPYNGHLYSVYSTPIDGSTNADRNDFQMTARESRVFLKTTSDTQYGTLTSHIEGDFFADIDADSPTWSNSNGFRIRHAYIKLQDGPHSLLTGQTWSNFMDLAGSLPSMDFSTDPGNSFVRQPQARYQYDLRPGHHVAVSLENPTLGMCQAGPATLVNCGGTSDDRLPDTIIKYFYADKRVTLSPRALIRRFELEGQSKTGYGLAVNGTLKFGNGHKAVVGIMVGDGIGRYAGLGFNAGAGVSSNGKAETLKYKSIMGGFNLAVGEDLLWSFGAGYSEQDEEGFEQGVLTGAANREAFSWHSNLYWNIDNNLQYALGVMSGEVENMAGQEGDMTRFQTYLKYTF